MFYTFLPSQCTKNLTRFCSLHLSEPQNLSKAVKVFCRLGRIKPTCRNRMETLASLAGILAKKDSWKYLPMHLQKLHCQGDVVGSATENRSVRVSKIAFVRRTTGNIAWWRMTLFVTSSNCLALVQSNYDSSFCSGSLNDSMSRLQLWFSSLHRQDWWRQARWSRCLFRNFLSEARKESWLHFISINYCINLYH